MNEKIKMNVEMEVTVPQGLALQAMFEHWNKLAGMGCSRMIGFYVDGDGNFHPKCKISFDQEVPPLTEELIKAAKVGIKDKNGVDCNFDFDGIAWLLHKD